MEPLIAEHHTRHPWLRTLLIAIFAFAVAAFFYFDVPSLLTIQHLKSERSWIEGLAAAHPVKTPLLFFVIYASYVGLCLPAGTIFMIAAGAIFDFWTAVVLVSFASTLGSVLSFLASRFILRDFLYSRPSLSKRLHAIDEGVKRDGAFYLFTTRLIPGFPYTVINMGTGLTEMPVLQFAWISQLGTLPNVLIYTNAGSRLAQIDSVSDIFDLRMVISLVAMGCIPLVAHLIKRNRRRNSP